MAKRRKKGSVFTKLWFITLVLIGLFIAGLYYIKQHGMPLPEKATKPNNIAKSHPKHESKKTAEKPQFDFYTILPQEQSKTVPAVKPNAATNTNTPALPQPPTAINNNRYVLQVAAVKNYSDADSMKAELTLQGYNVNIQKVTTNKTTLNRVVIGPYATLAEAQADQTKLQQDKMSSILVKVK